MRGTVGSRGGGGVQVMSGQEGRPRTNEIVSPVSPNSQTARKDYGRKKNSVFLVIRFLVIEIDLERSRTAEKEALKHGVCRT